MDPSQAFEDMYRAMVEKRYANAYELASGLKEWIDKGGFIPYNHCRQSFCAYVYNVIRRTRAYSEA